MRILGRLLIWGSLAAGAASASTAYLVALDAPDGQLIGLELAAPAGKVEHKDGTAAPMAEPGSELTAPLLEELRRAGVRNARVKEFAWARWRGKWVFLGSLLGLAVGAVLVRRGDGSAAAGPAEDQPERSPRRILEVIRDTVERLRAEVRSASDRASDLQAVIDQLGEVQRTQVPDLVNGRARLVAALGMSGYAVLMDTFAAAERQINRAWSAAVDGQHDEVLGCLEEASLLLAETMQELP
jgi:hypothetical protein